MSASSAAPRQDLPRTRDSVLLLSSLLNPVSRLMAEAKQKKRRKRKLIPLATKIELEDNGDLPSASAAGTAARNKKRSAAVLASLLPNSQPALTEQEARLARLQGQILPDELRAEAQEQEWVTNAMYSPVVQFAWESLIQWGNNNNSTQVEEEVEEEAPLDFEEGPHVATTTTTRDGMEEVDFMPANEDDQMEWDEAVPIQNAHNAVPTEVEISLPQVKRTRTQWDLPSNSSTTKPAEPVDEKELRRWSETTNRIGRNTQLLLGKWEDSVAWNPAAETTTTHRNKSMLVRYHHLDEAFALDEIARQKAIRIEAEKQEKLQQERIAEELKQQQAAAAALAPPTTTTTTTTIAPAVATERAPTENPALLGKIQEVPPQKKNQAGRGPPKKELMARRYAAFGEVLAVWGVLGEDDAPYIPPPPPPPKPAAAAVPAGDDATAAGEKSLMEPSYLGWRTIVPQIRHSEPAVELEYFDPQLRDKDPVKSYRRPLSHQPKEGVKTTLLTDANEYLALVRRNQSDGGGGGLERGIRVDLQHGSSAAPAADRQWRRTDLSNAEGNICLFEYAEQHPLLQNGMGMASNLLNFYRQESSGAAYSAPSRPDLGLFVGLAPDEVSPLMTRILPGRVYRVLQNNVMNTPVFEHQRSNTTDFLLVRPKLSAAAMAVANNTEPGAQQQQQFALIRKIRTLFTCGQVEPQIEIFQPNEPNTTTKTPFMAWLERFMEFHFATRLKRRDDLKIQFQVALDMFNLANEKMVERSLSNVAEKERQGGDNRKRNWVPIGTGTVSEATGQIKTPSELRKDLEEKRRLYLSTLKPEDCVSWEQLQLGLAKLSQAGITKVARAEIVTLQETYAIMHRLHELRESSHNALAVNSKTNAHAQFPLEAKRQLAAARHILHEMYLTPWFLSTCFYWLFLHAEKLGSPFPPDTTMKINRLGDPSGMGIMVSFLPSQEFSNQAAATAAAANKKRLLHNRGGVDDDDAEATETTRLAATTVADDEVGMFFDVTDGKRKARKKAAVNPDDKPKYGGTDNDLRILKMERLGEILMDLGIPPEEVTKISRWDRTWLIEKAASSKQGHTLLGGTIARYARVANPPSTSEPPAATVTQAPEDATNGVALAASGDDVVARKKLEESAVFSKQREALTVVYDRMMAELSNGKVVESSAAAGADAVADDDFSELARNMELRMMGNAKLEEHILEGRLRPEQQPGGGLSADLAGGLQDMHAAYKPYKILKRTIIEVLPDGTERIRVEYHRTEKAVKQYHQRLEEKKRQKEQDAVAAIEAKTQQQHQQQQQQRSRKSLALGPGQSSAAAASAGGVAPAQAERERLRAEQKQRQNRELQAQHAAWYKQQVAQHGKDFHKTFVEDDERLPSTMPRRGRSKPNRPVTAVPQNIMRCTVCFLPGHGKQSVLCPLYDANARAEEANNKARQQQQASFSGDNAATSPGDYRVPAQPRSSMSKLSGPLGELTTKFLRILNEVEANPLALPFLQPVSKRQFPLYPTVVRHPMDLSKIRDKAERGLYKSRNEFVGDLQFLVSNSDLFNGRNSAISDQARGVVKQVKELMDPDELEYKKLEELVAALKLGSKKNGAAAASTAPQNKPLTATAASASTASSPPALPVAMAILPGGDVVMEGEEEIIFEEGGDDEDEDMVEEGEVH